MRLNKKYQIGLILLLLIIMLVVIFFSKKDVAKEITIDQQEVVGEEIVDGSYETKTFSINDPYIKTDIKYPHFKNADEAFNSSILGLIKEQVDINKEISKENWTARYETQMKGENIAKYPRNENEKFDFYSSFNVIQSNETYISFVLSYGGFTGGAHGYENKVSFNYDVKSKKILSLEDLFKNSPDYLKYLSEKSRDYLYENYTKLSDEEKSNSSKEAIKEYIDNVKGMIDMGTEPNKDNFSVFTFSKGKIKIYFGQYQVVPYVMGTPEIEIDIK